MDSYKIFEDFCKVGRKQLTDKQKILAMTIFATIDLHPELLHADAGKTFLFRLIDDCITLRRTRLQSSTAKKVRSR